MANTFDRPLPTLKELGFTKDQAHTREARVQEMLVDLAHSDMLDYAIRYLHQQGEGAAASLLEGLWDRPPAAPP